MNSSDLIENILRIFQIVNILIGIICTITFDNNFTIISFVILFFIIISLLITLYSKERYIKFVDFLFDNEKHNFNLLPKMRMYLNNKKKFNKLDIRQVKVRYEIKHKQSTESSLLGDVDILYKIEIKNKAIPNTYFFITGNDYSNKVPRILYKYGTMDSYSEISPEEKSCAIYYKNVVRDICFNIDKKYITQSGNLKIELKVCYENSFEFEHNYMDTIICLPKIFGDNVENMKYDICLQGFPNDIDFYFFTYIICANKLKFGINNIPNVCNEKNKHFSVEFSPKSTRKEQAYYFRIGIHDTDKESRF